MTKAIDVQQATSAERILSTALDLFAVKGYDATAVREICEAAGITKPTLYHFFGSKDGVLQALVNTGFQQYRALVNAAMDTPGSFEDAREGAGAIGLREREHANRCSGASCTASSGRRPERRCRRPKAARSSTTASSARCGGRRESGRTGRDCAGPTEARMLILMGSISEAATGFVIAGKPELTPELADEIVDTIFNGWQ